MFLFQKMKKKKDLKTAIEVNTATCLFFRWFGNLGGRGVKINFKKVLLSLLPVFLVVLMPENVLSLISNYLLKSAYTSRI